MAQPLEDGTYAVKNVPFYAKGISCEDVIKAEPDEGVLVFKGVVRYSGHSTYRILASPRGTYLEDWPAIGGTDTTDRCPC